MVSWTINATQFGLKLNIWLEFHSRPQPVPVWEERGGGKSLSTHVRLSTSSQQYLRNPGPVGTKQNRCHRILQVKGFFIRFKIESLLACFRRQNADNNRNRPQRLCFMAMQYGHYDLCWSPVHDSSSAPPYPPYVIHRLSLYHNITWSWYSEHDKL